MDQKQAEELAAYLQSKEFRKISRQITIPLGVGLATGGWGFLLALLGFKLLAPEFEKDRETFTRVIDNARSGDFWSRFRQSWNRILGFSKIATGYVNANPSVSRLNTRAPD